MHFRYNTLYETHRGNAQNNFTFCITRWNQHDCFFIVPVRGVIKEKDKNK